MEDMFLDVPTEVVESPALHIMDNMEHESTTAHLVQQTAHKLGSDHLLKVIVANCFEYSLTETYDFIWLDGITTDDQFPALFDNYCKCLLRDGGYIAVHSTLTNTVTRKWMANLIQEMKRQETMVTVRFEVKPLDSDDDLNALATSIRNHKSDIEWIGTHRLEPIGFGINRLILVARMSNFDLAQDIAEWMEGDFEDRVGSVDVFLDEDSPSVANFHHVGFLEPHKRFQNSFTIFQKRSSKYCEPIFSWSP
jgi:translation elongation factor EF-1beta